MTTLTASSQLTDGCDVAMANAIDRLIRISTAVAVLAVASVAAYVSYWYAYAVVRTHGESGLTARLEPATIDGLVYASSMVILYAARHGSPVPRLARWLLGLGIAATLTANMAQGWPHGPTGAAVAAWPAVSLVGSYELLVWLIRTAAPDQGPPAQQASGDAADSAPGRPVPAGTANGGQPGSGEGKAPDQARQPGSQPAAHTAVHPAGANDERHAAAGVTFTDDDPAGNLSQYSGTIAWGDGSTVTIAKYLFTKIPARLGGGFAAGGLHTYARPGSYVVTVTINDVGGASASRSATLVVPSS